MACLIPIRHFEDTWTAGLLDLDRVLQGIGLLDVLRVVRIGQRPNSRYDIARADLI